MNCRTFSQKSSRAGKKPPPPPPPPLHMNPHTHIGKSKAGAETGGALKKKKSSLQNPLAPDTPSDAHFPLSRNTPSDAHFRLSPVTDRLKCQKTNCSNPSQDLGPIKIQFGWCPVSLFLPCRGHAGYCFATKFKPQVNDKHTC